MPFVSKLVTEEGYDEKGKVLDKLVQPLVFKSEWYKRVFVVPEGFRTNYASVPWYVRPFFPKMKKHRAASAFHDYLYDKSNPYGDISRERADELFLEAMLSSGVSRWVAKLFYKGVRAGGASRYKKHD